MSLSNNPLAILVICVAVAGFAVCMGAAISTVFRDPAKARDGINEPSDEQKAYMSEVRSRYVMMLQNGL
jgi:hypothetical protein